MTRQNIINNTLQQIMDNWIGLEHLWEMQAPQKSTFPPHDIYRDGDNYTITMALAGYKAEDIAISTAENKLIVESNLSPTTEDPTSKKVVIHKGIAARSFKQVFNLGPEIVVDRSTLSDGLLTILLHREIPEIKKPKMISIEYSK